MRLVQYSCLPLEIATFLISSDFPTSTHPKGQHTRYFILAYDDKNLAVGRWYSSSMQLIGVAQAGIQAQDYFKSSMCGI